MKLTWFGATTLRLYIGGEILVADPYGASERIDRAELVSGADKLLALGGAENALTYIDAAQWKPRRSAMALEVEADTAAVLVWSVGPGVVLIDAIGEPPLVLVAGAVPEKLGRWARDAVFVLFGDGEAISRLGRAVLDAEPPRLLALAGDEAAIETAVAALREHLDGTGLVSLERALALEV